MQLGIGNYMVRAPYTCETDWKLTHAIDFMTECGIRHLPVVQENRVVGIVSERDLLAAKSLPQSNILQVGDVMVREVFVARRTTAFRDVLRTMHEAKLGSTVIINDALEAIGIFTVTDAVGILADLVGDEEDRVNLAIDEFVEEWEWESVS